MYTYQLDSELELNTCFNFIHSRYKRLVKVGHCAIRIAIKRNHLTMILDAFDHCPVRDGFCPAAEAELLIGWALEYFAMMGLDQSEEVF